MPLQACLAERPRVAAFCAPVAARRACSTGARASLDCPRALTMSMRGDAVGAGAL